ncbi:hypothetical protein VE03_02074 [Pseudogymnoascus sp. 23342-1-I1]|nr:hypothetical protein VE03_02074 [Pseudogymnoascus sp. 23342-1-I1]
MMSFGTGNQREMLTMEGVDTLIRSTSSIYPDVDAVNTVSLPVGDKSSHTRRSARSTTASRLSVREWRETSSIENTTKISTKRGLASDDPESPGLEPGPT